MSNEHFTLRKTAPLQGGEGRLSDPPSPQEALAEMSRRALNCESLEELIPQTLDLLIQTLKADYCEVLELLPEENKLFLRAGMGWHEGYIGSAYVDAGPQTHAGFTLKSKHAVIVQHLPTETRFPPHALLTAHNILSGVTVIIPGKEHPYGILGVHSYNHRAYTDQDANFLQNLANLFALVADRQRIQESLRASREEQAIIVEGITEGITIQAEGGQIIYANDLGAQLSHFPDKESMLQIPIKEFGALFEYFDESGAPFPVERLPGRRALRGEKDLVEIIRSRFLPTGKERWLIVRASPVYDALNRPVVAVNIFQDITALKEQEADQRFLALISDLLSAALDYNEVLAILTEVSVDYLADWCVVHLMEDGKDIQRLQAAHTDPQKNALLLEMQQKYPPHPTAEKWFYEALSSGKILVREEISDDVWEGIAHSPEHMEMMRALEFRSFVVLPMVARGRSLGAITLVWTGVEHHFSDRERRLGMELAHRAAMVLDNIRLYQTASALNAELEEKVAQRTALLEQTNADLNAEIAERIRVEKNLESSSALFSDLFNLSPDAIFLIHPQGKILRANEQGEAIFGYKREEMVGASIDALVPEQLRSRESTHRDTFHMMPERRNLGPERQLYGRRKSGEYFPVDVLLSPVQVEGEMLMISSVRDITEHKRIQAELDEVQHRLFDSTEAERLMLAQELHDGTIQELFSVNFQLSEIQQDLEEGGNLEAAQRLRSASQMSQQVIQGLRDISRELRPPALAPFGLEQAILSHMEHFQEIHPDLNVDIELTPDGQILDEKLRLILFRIYQNAVSNVVRHAQADNLWVRLDLSDQQVVLAIEDDGKGFQIPKRWVELARVGHLGLIGMRERVEAIGGQLRIVSRPNEGTLIRVVVPLNPS